MPKLSKTCSPKVESNPSQDEASTHVESSSDQENDQEVIVHQSHIQQAVPSMRVPGWTGLSMMVFIIGF